MPTDQPGNDAPSGEDEFFDRRTGADRRAGKERRHGGRRHRRVDVNDDRRRGEERRAGDRRVPGDRRRVTDPRYTKRRRKPKGSRYSAGDVGHVQHVLTHIGAVAACPVCAGRFTLGPVDRRGRDTVRQVSCAECGRGLVVTNCVLARVMVLTRVAPVRDALRAILTGAGHEVVEPPHAGAALDVYRDNPADVVFLDAFSLAEVDGQEFIRRLHHEFSDARIVVLAPRPSYRMADRSATALRLGATRVVRTPFTTDDILRALRAAPDEAANA
jgi:CheY-like chemotaxis protein